MKMPDFREWAALMLYKNQDEIEQDLIDLFNKGVNYGYNNGWVEQEAELTCQTPSDVIKAVVEHDRGLDRFND